MLGSSGPIPVADVSPLNNSLLNLKSLHQTDHKNVHSKIVINVYLQEPQMPYCQVSIRVTDTSLSKDIKITHITCMHSSTLLKGMFPLAHTGEVEE